MYPENLGSFAMKTRPRWAYGLCIVLFKGTISRYHSSFHSICLRFQSDRIDILLSIRWDAP